ncbi:NADH-quinone oxidoreductase subunit N [mine drainage metagenome]|uniref:NADH-quinone oxidoreductase subunit N n=1 Tax=mine drainage metagenome TaxID=410659 RepID=A0A1J5SUF6_9ZZZZ
MNAIILSALLGVVMMFSSVFTQNKMAIRNIAIIGLLVLLTGNLLNIYTPYSFDIDSHNMLRFDNFGLFFNSIAIVSTLLYVILSGSDIVKVGNYPAEYFALIFFVLCGVTILSSYNSLLMLFLGVEIMSIPLYILTGADKKNLKSNEASLKYFLMGAFSTGIMLMGIALLYGASGNFTFEVVHDKGIIAEFGILSPLGLLLIFISLAFKVSAAPFHFWTPDVYDGAPSVFTSFMATIVKAAGFIAFIKLFSLRMTDLGPSYSIILPVVIISTLLVGNITAVFQQSVKRMLAYSSIAQAGFMLFALYSNNDLSVEGILLYATAYSIATIGIFAILIKMKDYTFDGYNGLAKKQPLVAATNTVFLLSLAGIPLTAGFFAKYYMLASALKNNGSSLWLVIVAVLFAAVSVYYYFRVIQAMYFKDGDAETSEINNRFKFVLVVLAVLIILIGINPSILLQWYYF